MRLQKGESAIELREVDTMPDGLWDGHARAGGGSCGGPDGTRHIQHFGVAAGPDGMVAVHRHATPVRRMRRVSLLPVRGMFCRKCVRRVEARLRAIPGVTRVVVDLSSRGPSPVLVEYEESARDEIRSAIAAAGFVVPDRREAGRG